MTPYYPQRGRISVRCGNVLVHNATTMWADDDQKITALTLTRWRGQEGTKRFVFLGRFGRATPSPPPEVCEWMLNGGGAEAFGLL